MSSSAGEDGASPLLLSLCQVPYMLDSETKSRILLLEVWHGRHVNLMAGLHVWRALL